MLETIQKIIYQITGKRNVTDDTDFVRDLELNSFDIMNIVAELEDTYDIEIPTRDVWHLNQVKDAITYLRKRGVRD